MGDAILDLICVTILIFIGLILDIRKENKNILKFRRMLIKIRKNKYTVYLDSYPFRIEGTDISLYDVVKIEKNIYSWTFYTHLKKYKINLFTGKIASGVVSALE